MPVRPEYRQFYRGPSWRATRARMRERGGDRCEQCAKPNGFMIETFGYRAAFDPSNNKMLPPMMFWRTVASGWYDCHGRLRPSSISFGQKPRVIRVVLTVAHLNHTPGDDRDENLRLLCQWCHLNLDKLQHKQTRSARKDQRRPILNGGATE